MMLTAGVPKRGWTSASVREEQAVFRHRVVDARRRDRQAVGRREDRHQDHRGDQLRRAGTDDRADRFRGDAIRARHAGGAQRGEVTDVREQIDPDQRGRADHDRARKGPLRIDRLAGGKRHVLPAFVRPQHADHRRAPCRRAVTA